MKKTLENLEIYEVDEYKKDWLLKLDSNENAYGCNKIILDAIKNIDKKEISLYPCYGELLDILSKEYGYKKENYLLTNGCDEALNILISAFINENENIISYQPSFSMPALYAKAQGAEVKYVEYVEKYKFDIEKINNAIDQKTKIIYVASPNNPTGECVNPFDILNQANKTKNILYIIDCTYINFSDNFDFKNYTKLIENSENIVVVKSFSKDFALAGLRLGFILASEAIIKNLKKISSPYNVNSIAVYCAKKVLENKKEFKKIKEDIIKTKEILYKRLLEAGFKPYKSEANFILCDFLNYCDFYFEKLKKNGIIVRKYSKDSSLNTCLRITIPRLKDVKKLLKLFDKKNLLIFDIDGVIFDVDDSYMQAIKEVYEHFSNKKVTIEEIKKVKSLDNMNCDYNVVDYLLKQDNIEISMNEIIKVFQDLFFRPDGKKNYLIDREKLQITKKTFEKLSKKYDMAVFSGRESIEVDYSFKRSEIDKYFYYFITSDKLAESEQKPSPVGLEKIKQNCPCMNIKYLGDSIDDIKAGKAANIETIGILVKNDKNNEIKKENFKNFNVEKIVYDIKKLEKYL